MSIVTLATISPADLDAMMLFVDREGNDHTLTILSDEAREAILDAYRPDDAIAADTFTEDYDAWISAGSPRFDVPSADSVKTTPPANPPISNATDTVKPESFVGGSDSARAASVKFNDTAVDDIVTLVRAKFDDDATRSFAIGKRFFEHAQWQAANFVGTYEQGDWVKLASKIRDEVRMFVQIKESSIRLTDWARCHVLREVVRNDAGDVKPGEKTRSGAGDAVADSLTMYEYLAIVGKALHFDVKNLTGTIKPCWLDMIRSVAADRASARVTSDDFRNRITATENRIKAIADDRLTDEARAQKHASDAVKASSAKVAKSVKSVTDSLNDAIADGSVTPEASLAILESVAQRHGKPLVAASIGFDATTATIDDCRTLSKLFATTGRIVEMKALRDALSRDIAMMERFAAQAATLATVTNAPADVAELAVSA